MKPSISLRTAASAPLSSDAAGREASIAQATSIHVGVGGPRALRTPPEEGPDDLCSRAEALE
eukprot:CAMPEP_0203869082 /NCGR_PEP_ID=MMETSP0359-20131031/17501_1 /ASSEMBLY_ACC=CAM_ASM_000338 /TAXON_ID=268821 /ORGANISM="Scrippsiella Hangoei, Strain SHTV-5" /LENGTH=61 /DNA_ID=CAMNT_0050787635 /DNA_START=349 /DNA_END=532 /DNA_ORIENTATION=+